MNSSKDNIQFNTKAGFLSHLFFWWQIPIVLKGWKKDFTRDDLSEPVEELRCKGLGDTLEAAWFKEEETNNDPSLIRALGRTFGYEFAFYGIFGFSGRFIIILLQPYFLKKILDFFTPNQTDVTIQEAYLYTFLMMLLGFIDVITYHKSNMGLQVLGMKIRIACSSLIYKKCLKLKKSSTHDVTVGHLVNLFSNDVHRFDLALPVLHHLWTGPADAIIGSYYLSVVVDLTAISGVILILLYLILQVYFFRRLSDCRKRVAVKTDNRIQLLNDIISGIQTIKMYTWEKPFSKLLDILRRSEMKEVTRTNYLHMINDTIVIFLSKLCIYLSVLVAYFSGISLTAQYVFTITAVYEHIRYSVAEALPEAVNELAEFKVTIQRIEEFLLGKKEIVKEPETLELLGLDSYVTKCAPNIPKNVSGIYAENVSANWKSSGDVLTEITLTAISGELVGITGAAGSGKSTLLHVMLQEVESVKGILEVMGTTSYASQEPWIFPASVRQNILFGNEMNEQKYLKIIRICALEPDLQLFSHGDHTLVGERGAKLSGGQKARINLARAIYKDADIYLLDDPLSAVDSNVAKHIFEECILGYLKNKCVILVTHQIQYLENVPKVYLIENGKNTAIQKDQNFTTLSSKVQKYEDTTAAAPVMSPLVDDELPVEMKEHRTSGVQTKKLFKNYLRAGGSWYCSSAIVLAFIVGQILATSSEYFLTFWVNLNQDAVTLDHTLEEFFTNINCMTIYTILTVAAILGFFIAGFMYIPFTRRASKTLYDSMFMKVLYAPLNFFNNHSSGRILNRFSRDIGTIDEEIPSTLMTTLKMILFILSMYIVICIVTYWMVLPTICVILIFLSYCILFQPVSRNIKRTEGIARSPVYTHLACSMQGLTTIRALSSEEVVKEEYDKHQDIHTSAFYLYIAIYNALAFWTELTYLLYSGAVAFGFFLISSDVKVGHVGLTITQLLQTGMIEFGMKIWSQLDIEMTSVERVGEYAQITPEVDNGRIIPSLAWPKGQVEFRAVSLRYSPDKPMTLQNVSFSIQPGEKIGIVGRTGAGKSSLISVLFRLYDFEGSIIIDNIDTKTITLNSLRAQMSIIPQDPVLFVGTLRRNLDPFDEFTDTELWNVLEEVELKEMFSNFSSGLDVEVSEGGGNFSVGQRQLLCLVRSMLKNAKIIVLDEATANVDMKTDSMIQSTIRRKFKNCTVLTIAHRLNTVMDSDKILVMEAGSVVEFDTPSELFKNNDGFFSSYVKKND